MASSSGRSHVDVNERRLRPIYDCLDNGNNKKAIQEADRILKKQRDFSCAKALKCLALVRLGRHDESTPLLQDVHCQQPHDEPTLQAMAMCYRELYKLDLMADMYENAYKKKPDSEEILNALFMAYVRIGNYKKQQQVAMALHKLRPQKNPYYFWAVMSIVMQAYENENLANSMFLPLAGKMVEKFINEGRLEAEAEVRIYLIILQSMAKFEEALAVLKGPLSEKLVSEPDFPSFLEVELLTKLELWTTVNTAYKRLIESNPDSWQCYKEYLRSSFILIDAHSNTEDGVVNCSDTAADDTVERVVEFLSTMVRRDRDSREGATPPQLPYPIRGPYLGRLELLRILKDRNDVNWNKVLGNPLELICQYYDQFGDKPCCFSDLQLYAALLNETEKQQMITELLAKLGIHSQDGQIVMAADIKVIQRHILLIQLSRYYGFHRQMETEKCLSLAEELLQRYTDGLKFGESLTSTDQQYVDSYMLLLIHLLHDVALSTKNDQYIWHALVLLEMSLTKSPTNSQLKLLAIQLYAQIGAFMPCYNLYESLEIKHIQHDTLGYVVCNHVLRLGHLSVAHTIFDNTLRFFASVHKDTSDYLISCYKYGSFPKVQEFVQFRHRLQNSLQFAICTAEKLLLDIISNASSHQMTVDIINGMDIDPMTEQTDFSGLCDNRDDSILFSCEPNKVVDKNELKQKSFLEEKAWLHIRNLTARCLVTAVRLGSPLAGGTTAPESAAVRNGSDAKTVKLRDVLVQLRGELAQCLSDSRQLNKSQMTNDLCLDLYRTRLSAFMRLDLGDRFLIVLDLLLSSELHQNGQQDGQKASTSFSPAQKPAKSLSSLTQENRRPMVMVCGEEEHKQIMVEMLENSVLLAEHISQVTIVMGACHEILKPFKASLNKKGKKKKEMDPVMVSVFKDYDRFLSETLSAVGDLQEAFSEPLAGDKLAFQLDGLKIENSNPLFQQIDEALEPSIRKKVTASYQTTAAEMKTLLDRKLRYLENLKF